MIAIDGLKQFGVRLFGLGVTGKADLWFTNGQARIQVNLALPSPLDAINANTVIAQGWEFAYQQQFTFFDPAKMGGMIRFINLSQVVLDHDLGAVLDAIVKEVETFQNTLMRVKYAQVPVISESALSEENFESIHNHSAYALIERDKQQDPPPP